MATFYSTGRFEVCTQPRKVSGCASAICLCGSRSAVFGFPAHHVGQAYNAPVGEGCKTGLTQSIPALDQGNVQELSVPVTLVLRLVHLLLPTLSLGSQASPDVMDTLKAMNFWSISTPVPDVKEVALSLHSCCGYLIDPHTCVGMAGLRQFLLTADLGESVENNTPLLCMACAHPAKFPAFIQQVTETGPHPRIVPFCMETTVD